VTITHHGQVYTVKTEEELGRPPLRLADAAGAWVCGIIPSTNQPVDLGIIAAHEAGHAVMRRILGLRATRVWATEEGGMCEGTGLDIDPKSDLLVTLAGIAVETSYRLFPLDLAQSRFDDLDKARGILLRRPWLFLDVSGPTRTSSRTCGSGSNDSGSCRRVPSPRWFASTNNAAPQVWNDLGYFRAARCAS
jgi:hypothetical protein